MSGSLAKKTIKAKVLELRKEKKSLLFQEYESWQKYIHGNKSVSLYSATKQQAERFIRRLKKQNGGILDEDKKKEYPLILRNDIYEANTKLTPYWFRTPVAGSRGKVNVPIGISYEIPNGGSRMREAKLLKEGNDFYIYITIEQEVEERQPASILGVDAGIRNIATTVNSVENRPRFYGKELRENQAHFYHLRKKLQTKGCYGAVKRIGQCERRITNDILHKISRKIVDEADKHNSLIVIGDLNGIRNQRRYSRGFRRKLSNFPFYKLFQFIKYKAQWLGISVIQISEAYTSQTCHNCSSKGLRIAGKFQCDTCGHEYNADYNAAYNIMKRGIRHALSQGLLLIQPVNPIG